MMPARPLHSYDFFRKLIPEFMTVFLSEIGPCPRVAANYRRQIVKDFVRFHGGALFYFCAKGPNAIYLMWFGTPGPDALVERFCGRSSLRQEAAAQTTLERR